MAASLAYGPRSALVGLRGSLRSSRSYEAPEATFTLNPFLPSLGVTYLPGLSVTYLAGSNLLLLTS